MIYSISYIYYMGYVISYIIQLLTIMALEPRSILVFSGLCRKFPPETQIRGNLNLVIIISFKAWK